MLIGAICVPRPLEKILCSMVVENKLHEFAAEDAVCTATNNIDVVWWRTVCLVHIYNFSVIHTLFPYLQYSQMQLRDSLKTVHH